MIKDLMIVIYIFSYTTSMQNIALLSKELLAKQFIYRKLHLICAHVRKGGTLRKLICLGLFD